MQFFQMMVQADGRLLYETMIDLCRLLVSQVVFHLCFGDDGKPPLLPWGGMGGFRLSFSLIVLAVAGAAAAYRGRNARAPAGAARAHKIIGLLF